VLLSGVIKVILCYDVITGEVFAVMSHVLSLMSKIRSGHSDTVVLSICVCVCLSVTDRSWSSL